MNEYEQKGYDAWIELWCQYGRRPSAGECPARWMSDGPERSSYIRGWKKAQTENEEQT